MRYERIRPQGEHSSLPLEWDAAALWLLAGHLRSGMYLTKEQFKSHTAAPLYESEPGVMPPAVPFSADNNEETTQLLIELLMDVIAKCERHDIRLRAFEVLRDAAEHLPHAGPREYARRCVLAYDMIVDGSWHNYLELFETTEAEASKS